MLKLTEQNEVEPICPHCSQELKELWFSEIQSTWGKRYVYFCTECRKILGVSHRKGFWMG